MAVCAVPSMSGIGQLRRFFDARNWIVGYRTSALGAISGAFGFAVPALAQTTTTTEYYVVQDVKTKKCTIMDKKPETTMSVTILGDGAVFKTRTDAHTGMKRSRFARPTKRLVMFFVAARPPLRSLAFFSNSVSTPKKMQWSKCVRTDGPESSKATGFTPQESGQMQPTAEHGRR